MEELFGMVVVADSRSSLSKVQTVTLVYIHYSNKRVNFMFQIENIHFTVQSISNLSCYCL